MIVRNVCGVLQTFIELALSVGMFIEICGKEKLRGSVANIAALVVLGAYLSVALPTNIILLQCLPNVLFIMMPLLCLSFIIMMDNVPWRAVAWSMFVSGTTLLLRLPTVLICAVVYRLSYNDCVTSAHQWTYISILCIEILLLVCCLRKKEVFGNLINRMPFHKLFLFLTGFLEFVIVLYVINVDWESGYDINSLILMIALTVLLLLIVICLVLALEYHTVIRTNHILLANESRMMVYYNLLNDEINQKRKKNHDNRYEQEYLFDCLMNRQYEKGIKFLSEKCGKEHSQSNVIYTGSGMIDNLFARIAEQCRESHVKNSFVVDMHKFPIEESEFFVLLANLLDNAVEAALKCSLERYIELKIQERHSFFRLYIANSYVDEPMQDGKRLVSSKSDSGSHGWGLESVKDTVKKYDGIIEISYAEISYADKKFVVEIVFTD